MLKHNVSCDGIVGDLMSHVIRGRGPGKGELVTKYVTTLLLLFFTCSKRLMEKRMNHSPTKSILSTQPRHAIRQSTFYIIVILVWGRKCQVMGRKLHEGTTRNIFQYFGNSKSRKGVNRVTSFI